jgi:hypothetical protein
MDEKRSETDMTKGEWHPFMRSKYLLERMKKLVVDQDHLLDAHIPNAEEVAKKMPPRHQEEPVVVSAKEESILESAAYKKMMSSSIRRSRTCTRESESTSEHATTEVREQESKGTSGGSEEYRE